MSTTHALVRTPTFGRPVRHRLASSPTDDDDATAQVDRVIERLARRAFPPEDGFSLDVRTSPGQVRSVRLIVGCDAFDGLCVVVTRLAGGGYRGDEVNVAIDVRREAHQRPLDYTPGPPRIRPTRLFLLVLMFTSAILGVAWWSFHGLPQIILCAAGLFLVLGLERSKAREIQRTERIDRQQVVSALADQEYRWQWFGEQVDTALGGVDSER